MIRVFIGSHKRFERVEPVIKYSILKHASEPVEINFLRPEYYGCEDSGCTGFSKMRWEIPQICNHTGHAVYLDVDMILMDDIACLFYPYSDKVSHCMYDGSTEVMVINCANKSNPVPDIGLRWNCEDYSATPESVNFASLIHFTDLKVQPWFYEHPKPWLSKIWFDLEKEALEANTQ